MRKQFDKLGVEFLIASGEDYVPEDDEQPGTKKYLFSMRASDIKVRFSVAPFVFLVWAALVVVFYIVDLTTLATIVLTAPLLAVASLIAITVILAQEGGPS